MMTTLSYQGCHAYFFLLITLLYFMLSDITLSGRMALGKKLRKCSVKHRADGYVFVCPKGIPDKASERTVSRKRGPRGKKGDKGSPGPPGPQGPRGLDGKDGPQGPPGIAGPMGPRGANGTAGIQGSPGTKGNKGEMGVQGPQGPPGIPGNCISEGPLLLQRNGVHCLAGPMGPQGPKGDQGTQGDSGLAGAKGEKGDQGPPGSQGPRGSVGLPGLPGTLGRISCNVKFTEWASLDDLQSGKYQVYCSTAEFLQGFLLETRDTEVRYRYSCCGFN